MREELLRIMPEFKLIEDANIQEKAINVWIEAMKKIGWTFDDLGQMPFTLLIDRTSVNIIEHTRAVARCALEIAEVFGKEYDEKIRVNRDYLLAGALLHDVGKLFELVLPTRYAYPFESIAISMESSRFFVPKNVE